MKNSKHLILLEKVAAHVGIHGNEEADRLAGQHTKQ
jgi:ribonuclease HI